MKSIDPELIVSFFPRILAGLPATLTIVFASTAAGLLLGAILALVRLYKVPLLSQLSVFFISFLRGTPIIIQLFVVYYGLPVFLLPLGINIARMDKMVFVILAYSVSASALFAEVIRGAVSGVPIGQTEAGYSVGLTQLQTFRRIVAPQALLTALPGVASGIVGLLENTSLAFTLGVLDVIGRVKVIGGITQRTIEGYIGAAIIFVIVSLLLREAFSYLERRSKSKLARIGE